jgi:cation diffusion facilitator family transporter
MLDKSGEIGKVRRVTCVGMVVNVALAAAKAIAGIHCSSQALVADAVHSLSDMATDLAVILGVRFWAAPADDEHPYGHGKIEALVTLFISLALVLVAFELGTHAVQSLARGRHAVPGLPALFIAVASVVLKEWMFRWTRRVAREVSSPATEANAWHHRSDALSSIPVALAVGAARLFPKLSWLDPAGSLLVSLFILHVAWEIMRPALQELVDAEMERKSAEVADVARAVAGVRDVHKVRSRRYGGAFASDLHIHVDPALSIAEGHAIGHAVQDALLQSRLNVMDAVVHVEPAHQ